MNYFELWRQIWTRNCDNGLLIWNMTVWFRNTLLSVWCKGWVVWNLLRLTCRRGKIKEKNLRDLKSKSIIVLYRDTYSFKTARSKSVLYLVYESPDVPRSIGCSRQCIVSHFRRKDDGVAKEKYLSCGALWTWLTYELKKSPAKKWK